MVSLRTYQFQASAVRFLDAFAKMHPWRASRGEFIILRRGTSINSYRIADARAFGHTKHYPAKDLRVIDAATWVLLDAKTRTDDKTDAGPCPRCSTENWALKLTAKDRETLQFLSLNGKPSSGGEVWIRPDEDKLRRRWSSLWGRFDGVGPGPLLERQWIDNGFSYRLACCHGHGRRRMQMAERFFWWVDSDKVHGSGDRAQGIVDPLMVYADELQSAGSTLGVVIALVMDGRPKALKKAETPILGLLSALQIQLRNPEVGEIPERSKEDEWNDDSDQRNHGWG